MEALRLEQLLALYDPTDPLGMSVVLVKKIDTLETGVIERLLAETNEEANQEKPGLRQIAECLLERWANVSPEQLSRAIVAGSASHEHPFSPHVTTGLRALTATDPELAFHTWQLLPEPLRSNLRRRLIIGLLESSPELAGELYASAVSENDEITFRFDSFLGQLASRDPLAAVKTIDDLPFDQRESAYPKVGRGWAKSDPEAALRWAKTLPPSEDYRVAHSILDEMFTLDREKASSIMATLTPDYSNQEFIEHKLYYWYRVDSDAALAWVQSLDKNPLMQTAALSGIVEALETPDQFRQFLDSVPKGDAWISAWKRWVSTTIESDPIKAAELYLEMPKGGSYKSDQTFNALSRALLDLDPTAAAEFVSSQMAVPRLMRGIASFASEWANKDPEAAANWASQIGPEGTRKEAMADVVENWSKSDFAGARTFVEGLGQNDPAFGRIAAQLTNAWKDQDAALDWAVGLLETTAYPLNPIVSNIAETDPQLARSIISERVIPAVGGAVSAEELTWLGKLAVNSNAATDYASTTEWALGLPEGEVRRDVVAAAVAKWAKAKPEAAAELVRELPNGEVRDFSLQEYSSSLRETAPEQAWQWAMEIEEEELRLRTLYWAAQEWSNQEPEAAAAFVEEAGLTETLEEVGKRVPRYTVRISF
ncbi:MAG: hypothetical protein KDN22_28025 [Verrucomicrobiae bacterium]|nr:hypothetical protein [Verrucomicrobiae bacterium]